MTTQSTSTSSMAVVQQAERYRIRAHRRKRAHNLACLELGRMHVVLGVPVVVITAVVGTTIFATLAKSPVMELQVAMGLLSILAVVLSTLQTFFKFAERSAKHRVASAEYAAVVRALDLIKLGGATATEVALLKSLQELVKRIDLLERDSPDVPDRLYDRAVAEQKADAEGV